MKNSALQIYSSIDDGRMHELTINRYQVHATYLVW
jgi:hypothetical protein